jgi:hypothetical protein
MDIFRSGWPNISVRFWYCTHGSLPVLAVISAARRFRINPSLSVVHTVPSFR